MKNVGRLAQPAALLLGACVFAGGLMETTVRLFFPVAIQPRFVRDSGFGIRDNQSNVRTWHKSPGEYDVQISTNSDGLRGTREYPRAAPAGTRRIAILGDSFAFGYGCNDNQVVSAVLEHLLDYPLGPAAVRWEVPNFGVSGYGQAEELVLYRNKVRQYKPDTAVLFYFDNDIGNNAVADIFKLDTQGNLEATGKSFLPGVAMRQSMYAIAPLRLLFLHSQAFSLLRNRLSALVQNRLLKKNNLQNYSDATPQARALTRVLLLQMSQEIERDGTTFVIVVVPNLDLSSNFPFDRAEALALGLTVLYGREFVDTGDYYPADGHWKPSGHRKAADAIKSFLTDGSHPLVAGRDH
jgi:hypothetical protein